MNAISKQPPVDRRCQIYFQTPPNGTDGMTRCSKEGTHWEKWGGCGCPDPDDEVCEEDFYSWECDGIHDVTEAAA